MVEKGKLFPIVECQLINVEGMIELESHHLATTVVIIVLGKNYKNTSSNRSKFGEKQDIYIVSKNLSTDT